MNNKDEKSETNFQPSTSEMCRNGSEDEALDKRSDYGNEERITAQQREIEFYWRKKELAERELALARREIEFFC